MMLNVFTMGRNTMKVALIYALAAFIRKWLMMSEYQKIIADHIEISTPLNSWKRVTEGLYLKNSGVDPYIGDKLHEVPILLYFYDLVVKLSGCYIVEFFIFCDILTAHILYVMTKCYMFELFVTQEENKGGYAKDTTNLLLKGRKFTLPPIYVVAAYLFNPFIVFNCVGFTTTVFTNLFLSIFLCALTHGYLIVSSVSLAFCIFQTFYPVVLLSPLYLQFKKIGKSKIESYLSVVLVLFSLLGLILFSYYMQGNYLFLENGFGFILNVPDLHPNIGLFWYFFIEMFDHFRNLFIYSFQINSVLLYLVPLSIRFRKNPLLLAASLLSLISIFKSYPSVGDVGFIIALLPCWSHLFDYMQQGFLVGVNFLVTTALGPILWHLWIYSRSANANFYFGVTLAFATAQIFLITDVLFAYTKREFSLKYGRIRKIKGNEVVLVLE